MRENKPRGKWYFDEVSIGKLKKHKNLIKN